MTELLDRLKTYKCEDFGAKPVAAGKLICRVEGLTLGVNAKYIPDCLND